MQLPEESRQRIVRLFRADMEGLDGLLLDLREVELFFKELPEPYAGLVEVFDVWGVKGQKSYMIK